MSELEKQLATRDQPRPEMLPKFEFLRAEEPARGQTTDKRLTIKAQLCSSDLRGGHGQAQDRGAGEENQQEAGGYYDRGRDRRRAGLHYLVLPIHRIA